MRTTMDIMYLETKIEGLEDAQATIKQNKGAQCPKGLARGGVSAGGSFGMGQVRQATEDFAEELAKDQC